MQGRDSRTDGLATPLPHPAAGAPCGPWGEPSIRAPPRRPRRSFFKVGVLGHFIAAGTALPLAVYVVGYGFWAYYYRGASVIGLAVGVLFFVGLFYHLVGFLGFWWNYGSVLGSGVFIYGMAAILFFLIALVLTFEQPYSYYFLMLVAYILVGILFALEGAAFVVVARFTREPSLSVVAGILFLVAGVSWFTLAFAWWGTVLLTVAFVIGGVVLYQAALPQPVYT